MRSLQVLSAIEINAAPADVWPLLCRAKLRLKAPFWFRFAVPTPRECQLLSDHGGVGAERRCVSSRGHIRQRIVRWEENRSLAFEMIDDSVGLRRRVPWMRDTFTLQPAGGGTRLMRATELDLRGWMPSWVMRFVMRRIHRYVMRNSKAMAEMRGEMVVT